MEKCWKDKPGIHLLLDEDDGSPEWRGAGSEVEGAARRRGCARVEAHENAVVRDLQTIVPCGEAEEVFPQTRLEEGDVGVVGVAQGGGDLRTAVGAVLRWPIVDGFGSRERGVLPDGVGCELSVSAILVFVAVEGRGVGVAGEDDRAAARDCLKKFRNANRNRPSALRPSLCRPWP